MRIVCLQFAPELGKVDDNIRRAEAILSQTKLPSELDWLVLPEMAFSGKNFLYSISQADKGRCYPQICHTGRLYEEMDVLD
jgi:predicted amidohydrolase